MTRTRKKIKGRKESWAGMAIVRMNDNAFYTTNPRQIQSAMLSSITDLKYWSYSSLVRFYRGTGMITYEYCKYMRQNAIGQNRAKLTRFISSFQKRKNKIPRKRIDLLIAIYNTILAFEGISINNTPFREIDKKHVR